MNNVLNYVWRSLKWYYLDIKESWKNTINTQQWQEIIQLMIEETESYVKIKWIHDRTFTNTEWWGSEDKTTERIHRWLWTKIVSYLASYCIMNSKELHFTPATNGWIYWEWLSELIKIKHQEWIERIVLREEEVSIFKRDLQKII